MQATCPHCAQLVSANADKRFPPWCPKCGADFRFNPGDPLTGPSSLGPPNKVERKPAVAAQSATPVEEREIGATAPIGAPPRATPVFATRSAHDSTPRRA